MVTTVAGDLFEITGPSDHPWRSDRQGGWKPRLWSSYPGDPKSRSVRANELCVDFTERFLALEIRKSPRFVSARIEVDGLSVWLNVAKDGKDWVRRVTPPEGHRAARP